MEAGPVSSYADRAEAAVGRWPLWVQWSVLVAVGVVTWHVTANKSTDVQLYQTVSEHLGRWEWPYLSFPLEYPPLAAVLFAGPRLLGTGFVHGGGFYRLMFMVEAAAVAVAATPAVVSIGGRLGIARPIARGRYAATLIVLFPVVLARYDVFPAVTTTLALMYLLDGRSLTSGVWLGLGIGAKLYPVVLLGPFAAFLVARRRWSDLGRLCVGTGLVTLLPLLPYLLRGSTAFLSFLQYHQRRGLQVESLPGVAVLLAAVAHLTTAHVVYDFTAFHLRSPWAAGVLRWEPVVAAVLLAATVAAGYWRMAREAGGNTDDATGPRPQTLVDASVAVLLAFILTNKVFSPQYLVWVAPLIPLAGTTWFRWAFATCALTMVLFLPLYALLVHQNPAIIVVWNLRNLIVIGLWVALIARLLRRTARVERGPDLRIDRRNVPG